MRILYAPCDLCECISFQRIYTAKGAKPIWKLRHLLCRPIVLCFHPSVFILDRRPVWIAELIGQRQDERAVNSGSVQQRNEIAGSDRLRKRSQLSGGGT